MDNDNDAFIANIIANPDDDGIRLIYADWLRDQGEDDRADLIQVQIELGIQREDRSLRVRENHIINRIFRDGKIPSTLKDKSVDVITFVRGLVESISCSASFWESNAAAVMRQCPIRNVTLTTFPDLGRPKTYSELEMSLQTYPNDFERRYASLFPRVTFKFPELPPAMFQFISPIRIPRELLSWGMLGSPSVIRGALGLPPATDDPIRIFNDMSSVRRSYIEWLEPEEKTPGYLGSIRPAE